MDQQDLNTLPLSLITQCVDCCGELKPRQDEFECLHCKRIFKCDNHVWDFRQKQNIMPQPFIFNEPEYKRWLQIFSKQETKKWVIYRNPLFRFIAQAGHRKLGAAVNSQLNTEDLVLEIGAGTGALLNYVSAETLIAVDTSLESLQTLKTRWPSATAICADSTALPFCSNAFKYIVSLHTLEHLYFIAESLEESIRVIKPDGQLQYVIPTEGGFGFWFGRKLVTGPHLRETYQLDVKYVMDREHINDANRVMKFLKMYFDKVDSHYWPLPFLRFLSCNAMIHGVCKLPRSLRNKDE